jgi:hypothetical protein
VHFTYGHLATAVLWPIRQFIQDYDGDAIDTVRQIAGDNAKHVLKAVPGWGQDRQSAARSLAALAQDNPDLRAALLALIEQLGAIPRFAEQMARVRGQPAGGLDRLGLG